LVILLDLIFKEVTILMVNCHLTRIIGILCVDLLRLGGDKSPELVGTSYRNRWGQDSGIGGDECPEYAPTVGIVIVQL